MATTHLTACKVKRTHETQGSRQMLCPLYSTAAETGTQSMRSWPWLILLVLLLPFLAAVAVPEAAHISAVETAMQPAGAHTQTPSDKPFCRHAEHHRQLSALVGDKRALEPPTPADNVAAVSAQGSVHHHLAGTDVSIDIADSAEVQPTTVRVYLLTRRLRV